MKIFTNKSIGKKIVIAILIVLSFQIVMMKPVQADAVEFGGKLLSPIMSLLVGIGDGINDLISRTIMGYNSTLYEVEMGNSFWEKLGTIFVAIAAAAIAIVAIVATMGFAAMVAAALSITATVTIGMGTIVAGATVGLMAGVWYSDQVLPDDLYLPMYTYSAEEIFKGNILLFDVNYFHKAPQIKEHKDDDGKILYYYYIDENGNEIKTSNQNSAVILKNTVSSWYNGLRNICLVLMLSVLVYIGIRILLSSVASDKAKYLAMLKDWFIGLCLLFLMHYIMAFSVTLVEKLTDVVKTAVDENGYTVTIEASGSKGEKIKEAVDKKHLNMPQYIQKEEDGSEYLIWPTNLMGSLRLQLQMEDYGAQYVGLSICFLMLCLFTLYFTIIYMKRVLHIAFLTIIAPMVALTYCIDKVNDGQAQGFNKWFKEYIFNLLIQPLHLLLYYILVTSAFELASTNVIYSIVALGFMIPAEKLLRGFFGFEKAQTAPAMGPAGAMMASTALSHMLNKGSKGKGKDGGSASGKTDGSSDSVPNPIRGRDPMESFMGSGEETPAQQQQDAYNENFGTGDWDPLEANALAEAANSGQGGMQYSREDYEQMARNDLGEDATQQQIQDHMRDVFGIEPPQELTASGPTVPQPHPQQVQTKEKPKTGVRRRIKRMAHASWAAQKANVRSFPQRLVRKIENSHPMKALGKTAAGLTLGAAGAAAGVAIAATTGDPSNLTKIAGGAAIAGYATGSGRAQAIASPMDREEIKAVRDVAYNKGEYKQDAMNDYVKDYIKDVQNRNYFEQKFGKNGAKEMLKKGGIVEKCLYNEITDKKEIAAAYKLQKEGVVRNDEEAISIAQLGQMVGDNTNHMTTKRRNEWKTRFSDMAAESGVKDREQFAANRLRELDKFYDFKK